MSRPRACTRRCATRRSKAASACGRCSRSPRARCRGAAPERLEVAAAAVELIHAYSLVHDDLPCMDDDVLRRGKPTVHVEYDEATALLVGDALQTLAFQLLAEHRLADDPRAQLEMVQHARASPPARAAWRAGRRSISSRPARRSTLPELEFMHIHKTGALIRAAVLLGAACGRRCRGRAGSSSTATPRRSASPSRWSTTCSTAEAQHRDARQDRRQGLEAGQADLRVGAWASPRAQAARRGAARARRTRRSRPSARARGACASSPTSSFCENSSDGHDHRRAARRRRQSRDATSCSRRSTIRRELRALERKPARPARRRAARLRARVGVARPAATCRRTSARSSSRSRCTTCSTRPRTASSGTSATRPMRTRSSPAGARRWRACACSAASRASRGARVEVRHLRHRAFAHLDLGRARHGGGGEAEGREAARASR